MIREGIPSRLTIICFFTIIVLGVCLWEACSYPDYLIRR